MKLRKTSKAGPETDEPGEAGEPGEADEFGGTGPEAAERGETGGRVASSDPFRAHVARAARRDLGVLAEPDPTPFRTPLLVVLLTDLTLIAALRSVLRKGSGPWSGLGVIGALSVPFLFMIVMRPFLRRMAWRNLRRRGREARIAGLGAALATALVTMSLVVGNAFDQGATRLVHQQLGPIDELVVARGADLSPRLADVVSGSLAPDQIDGLLGMTVAGVSVSTALQPDVPGNTVEPETSSSDTPPDSTVAAPAAPVRRPAAVPRAQLIEVDFSDAQRFGNDPAATGIVGLTPELGHAVISQDLASALGVGPTASINVSAGGVVQLFTIDRVLPRVGIAGFWRSSGRRSLNLFVAPGTIGGLGGTVAQTAESLLAVSNRGGVVEGARPTTEIVDAIEKALEPALVVGNEPPPARPVADLSASVLPAKREALDRERQAARRFSRSFVALGGLSAFASTMLLTLTFLALASERRRESGTLRAVGLRRLGLIGSFALEGWTVAVVSSLIGAIAGGAIGGLVRLVADRVLGGDRTSALFQLPPARSVANGAALGFIASLIAVLIASAWMASIRTIDAFRGRESRPRSRLARIAQPVAGAAVGIAGALITIFGLLGRHPHHTLVGPLLLAFGFVVAATERIPAKSAITIGTAIVAGYEVLAVSLFPKVFRGRGIAPLATLGAVLTALGVIVLATHQRKLARFFTALGRDSDGPSPVGQLPSRRASAGVARRLGLGYPAARPLVSALVAGVNALLIFTIVFVAGLATLYQQSRAELVSATRGGYDAVVRTSVGNLPVEPLRTSPAVDAVAELTETEVEVSGTGGARFTRQTMVGFTTALTDGGAPRLSTRMRIFPTDTAAYEFVLGQDYQAIITEPFATILAGRGNSANALGANFYTRDPATGRSLTLQVVGITAAGLGDDALYVNTGTTRALLGYDPVPNRALISYAAAPAPGAVGVAAPGDLAPAEQVGAIVDRVSGTVSSFRQLVDEATAARLRFLKLLEAFAIASGLLGLLGLVAFLTRAVHERRRHLSLLRSIGAPKSTLAKALKTEGRFLVGQGAVLGGLSALAALWCVARTDVLGEALRLRLPIGLMAVLLVASMVLGNIVARWPARLVERLSATSLRATD